MMIESKILLRLEIILQMIIIKIEDLNQKRNIFLWDLEILVKLNPKIIMLRWVEANLWNQPY